MTLRARLTLGLLTIAVILVVPLVIASRSLGRLHSETKALRDGEFAASLLLGRTRDALNDVRASEMAILFVRDDRSRQNFAERVTTVASLADSLDAYRLGGAARDIRAAMSIVGTAGEAEYEAARAGSIAAAEALSDSQVVPAISRAETSLGAAERTLRQRTRDRVVHAAEHARQGSEAAILGLALALAAAGLIAFFLTRSVHRPVTELERGMRQVADGDFTATVDIMPDRTDEFGKLAASFGDMTRQLTELDKLKAEFVSVASHELKTPINVILGYTQLLQEELYGPLTSKQRQVADVIEAQSRTLARLAKQLLDVTRFEAGAGKLDVRPLQLAELLRQLEQSFQVLADQRGVRFNIVLHDGLPETVFWDSDRINEVLGNLLSNAFKFTERGGEVDMTVMPLEHAVQIEVRDSGAGIPPDQLPRIFEKFFQADNQGSASHAGTGLGLAIARQIVEAHNGTISADSTPGVGTTFTIVLPMRAAEARRNSQQTRAVAEVG
jgi:signal transduction histidine kinase